MIKRLEKFYAAFGDKGVMLCIYALTLVINSLFTISAQLPSVLTDEISSAGVSAFYSGRSWGGLLRDIGVHGYVQQLLYAPLFRFAANPFALYKAMLIENAVIISFAPVIAYHLVGKIGVVRVKWKLVCALSSGMYVTYIVNSKLIRNNAAAGLMTWILVWCVFAAWDKKNRYTRFVTSLATGFLCGFAYAIDERMAIISFAVILTAIIARYGFKEKIFNLPVLLAAYAASVFAEMAARLLVLRGAADNIDAGVTELFAENVGGGYIGRLFCALYAFITESAGLGSVMFAAVGAIVAVYIRERVKNKPQILDDNTKVYEAVKHKYSVRIMVFGVFVFIAAVLSVFAYAGFTFCGKTGGFSEFCIGLDNIAPLAVFFTLVFFVNYGADLQKLFIGAALYSFVCAGFSAMYYPYIDFDKGEKITAVLPFRFCESATAPLSGMSFIIMSSCVFSVFSVLIVFAACSKKRFMKLATAAMYAILIYNTAYAGICYLPETARDAEEKNAPYKAVSELLYNDEQSPAIIVAYDSEQSRELAGMIQFMNFKTNVSIMKEGDKVPESCLLVAENGVKAPFDGGSYDVVTKTGKYTIYAYGESARDFIRYSSVANGGNSSSQN